MGSSDCYIVGRSMGSSNLNDEKGVGNSNIGFIMPLNNNYTVVVHASLVDIVRKLGSKAVSQQKTINCVVMLEAGIK